MTNFPDWVHHLSDAELNRHFGASTVARGRQYAHLGRVGTVQAAGTVATASVRGSGYRTYQTTVTCPGPGSSLVATCSCPMRRDCKHAVALILRMKSPELHRAAPSWRQVLAPFTSASDPGTGKPLGLQVSQEGAAITLRPVQPGLRGNWIRSGAAWDDVLRTPNPFASAHRDALLALWETRVGGAPGPRTDALSIGDLLPAAWPALYRAVAAGVDLIPGSGSTGRDLPTPELLPSPVTATVEVTQGDHGALRLTPAVLWHGEPLPLPARAYLGRHGVAFTDDDRLWLGPLSEPLAAAAQALFQHGELSVPADDADAFASQFLPRVRASLEVRVADGLDLPEPQPPTLLCRIDFRDQSASVHWGFRYRVRDAAVDVGLAPGDDAAARDHRAEEALTAQVPEGPWRDVGPGGRVTLRPAFLTGRALIGFVTEALPALRDNPAVEVLAGADAPTFRRADADPEVTLRIDEAVSGDWFDLAVRVSVGDEQVPLAQLFQALSAGDDHLLLDSGTWFPLDAPELDRLRVLIEEARLLVDSDGDAFRLRPEHAGLWDELVGLGVVTEQATAWREAVGALLDPESLPAEPVPSGLRAELRPYQETGFRWLRFLWRARLGGVLADEMGLGKTLQALAAAQAALEAGELTEPMLVVAPTSVIGTWAAEAERFAPDLRVVTVTATGPKRGATLEQTVDGAHLVVTSYTLLRLEADAYRDVTWSAVLLDEAQFVKNHASKAYQAVRKLRARVKVALTGTPLENNLMDLWSLLSITSPGLFPDPKAFTEAFRRPIEAGDPEALARLHRRIRPLILRRTKAAVASELPDKQEQVVPVDLSAGHRRLYERHLARERQKVLGLVGDLQRNRITILRSLTLLRQLSLSPRLIDEQYPAASAKIDTLLDLLDEVVAEGHRALVFSQFTGFLHLVRDRLTDEGVGFEYLDGRTRDRAARIAAFREGDAPVFLISLKAGGFGLTLTEADYVFILDPWWNPAAENQAIDRTHRIGQDKPVNVYRLVAADTIEDKVVALQQRKRDLFDAVVGSGSDAAAPLSADDIIGLLDG